jgi:hypothetical protein
MNAKEILEENINYCQILMRLLARFGTDEDYKIRYMSIVEDFETEEKYEEDIEMVDSEDEMVELFGEGHDDD